MKFLTKREKSSFNLLIGKNHLARWKIYLRLNGGKAKKKKSEKAFSVCRILSFIFVLFGFASGMSQRES